MHLVREYIVEVVKRMRIRMRMRIFVGAFCPSKTCLKGIVRWVLTTLQCCPIRHIILILSKPITRARLGSDTY